MHTRLIKKWRLILVFNVFCLIPNLVSSQNYVESGNEMGFLSAVDFSISSAWETNKSANPGFFTWLSGAENYEGVSDSFHINGYAKKTGNSAFTFPVGSGNDLRTLSISAPANLSSEYAVAWLSGDPSLVSDPSNGNSLHSTTALSGQITAVSNLGQWDWMPIVGDGVGLNITVSIPALSGKFFTNPSEVRLVGWDGTAWVMLGSAGASNITEDSVLSGTMIAGIQAIGIGSITPSVLAPEFTVVQNSEGFLVISGTAEKDSSVLITFPDGSTVTVVTSSLGVFGPVMSSIPQDNKGVVTAIATNTTGISSKLVSVYYDYPVTVLVSEAFSPNGDGINDTWKIYELDKHPNSTVRVYNRWGNEVYSSKDYQNDWDGHYSDSSSVLPESGAYYYQIDYGSDGSVDKQGWLYIRK